MKLTPEQRIAKVAWLLDELERLQAEAACDAHTDWLGKSLVETARELFGHLRAQAGATGSR